MAFPTLVGCKGATRHLENIFAERVLYPSDIVARVVPYTLPWYLLILIVLFVVFLVAFTV